MINVMKDIYLKELVLVPDDSDGLSTPLLDLQLVITNGVVSTSIFDKRDAFDFPTTTATTTTTTFMSLSVIKCFDKRSESQWVLIALLFLPI